MIALAGLSVAAWMLASLLNQRLTPLHRFQLPPSLIGGVLLLVLGPQAIGLLPADVYESWKSWPAVLISFLFAGIILEPGAAITASRSRSVIVQALYVWMLAFLQLAAGYAVCAVFARSEDRLFAGVIELSWLGGPGSAAAFVPVAERLKNPAAGQLAIAAATMGLLWGSLSGIPLAAYHRRRHEQAGHRQDPSAPGAEPPRTPAKKSAGAGPVQAIPLAAKAALLPSFLAPVLPVFFAWMARGAAVALMESVTGGEQTAQAINDLPLFFFVIPASYLVKPILLRALNPEGVRLFHQLSLEGIILSAVATLSIALLADHGLMLGILCSAAALLSLGCHLLLSPRLLPHHPELSLINYGMATGTTALGLTLLRTYTTRPHLAALEIYGLAAPFSAPFIGGGMLSLLVFPELTVRYPPAVLLLLSLSAALLIGMFIRFLGRTAQSETEGA